MGAEAVTIDMNSTIVRDNDIIFSELDGEAVMVSMERGEYYGINPIGTQIWGEIETPRKVSDLCELLITDFNVTLEQCGKDVLAFLNMLAEKGVVKVVQQ